MGGEREREAGSSSGKTLFGTQLVHREDQGKVLWPGNGEVRLLKILLFSSASDP